MSEILSKIPRYDPNWNESSQQMELHPSGDYVEFEDCKTAVEAAIAELRQEVERLKGQLIESSLIIEAERKISDACRLDASHNGVENASLQAQLAACQWTPITESNLPKVGDEVLGLMHITPDPFHWAVDPVTDWHIRNLRTPSDYYSHGRGTHRRPINPPKEQSNG